MLFPENLKYKVKLEWMMDYLKRPMSKEGFDIIHAHDVLSILAMGSMPQKKILTLHGYFARENIEFVKDIKDRKTVYPYLFELEREAMRHTDYVIAVDQRLKDYAISEFNFPVDRTAVIHNAVDTDRFSPVSKEKQHELKKNMGFSLNCMVILVPRRLVEKNGVIYAVHAMRHLKNDNAKMIVAGDGPERDRINREAKEDHRIHFTGTIPHNQIDQYYKMSDVILIPSITSHGIQEASSLAMLEGMSCGKVVICSDIGGMHEIIQNMKNGILTKEKEPMEIAKAIETAIKNKSLMAKIGSNAREYVLKNHSFIAHAKKVVHIYHRVMARR